MVPAGRALRTVLDPKSIQIDASTDATIDAEKILKNDAQIIQNDGKLEPKSMETQWQIEEILELANPYLLQG